MGIEYAYRLLENEEIPGWLSMPKNGATTIWESWEGPNAQGGVASLNHYSKGAVCQWLFDSMCGINVAGENRFIIAPKPGRTFRARGGPLSERLRRDNQRLAQGGRQVGIFRHRARKLYRPRAPARRQRARTGPRHPDLLAVRGGVRDEPCAQPGLLLLQRGQAAL